MARQNAPIAIGQFAFRWPCGEEVGLRVETLEALRRAEVVWLAGVLHSLPVSTLTNPLPADRVSLHVATSLAPGGLLLCRLVLVLQ